MEQMFMDFARLLGEQYLLEQAYIEFLNSAIESEELPSESRFKILTDREEDVLLSSTMKIASTRLLPIMIEKLSASVYWSADHLWKFFQTHFIYGTFYNGLSKEWSEWVAKNINYGEDPLELTIQGSQVYLRPGYDCFRPLMHAILNKYNSSNAVYHLKMHIELILTLAYGIAKKFVKTVEEKDFYLSTDYRFSVLPEHKVHCFDDVFKYMKKY